MMDALPGLAITPGTAAMEAMEAAAQAYAESWLSVVPAGEVVVSGCNVPVRLPLLLILIVLVLSLALRIIAPPAKCYSSGMRVLDGGAVSTTLQAEVGLSYCLSGG